MNTTTPKDRILILLRQIYSEFTPSEISEAINQIRQEIETQAAQELLKNKIADLQKQLDEIA